MSIHPSVIPKMDSQAVALGHVPLEEITAANARTVMKYGLDDYLQRAFLCVASARTQFARDTPDKMADDLDEAIRNIVTAMWFLRGEDSG